MRLLKRNVALAGILLAVLLAQARAEDAAGTTGVTPPPGGPAPARKHVRLLAVGNSFSGNATRFLADIVKASGGNQLTFGHAAIGGCSLATHWKLAQLAETTPEDPKGKPYGGKSLKDMLTAESWDYVTIQQYSMDSFKVDTYRPYAHSLYDYIKKLAPQAEVLVHETWAYRADDPLFKPGKFTPEDMYRGLRRAYEATAGELGCRIIPVGDAFENARLAPAWGGTFPDPNYDYKSPPHPALPDQRHSLHAGYMWSKNKDGTPHLYMDGHHANAAGEYLGAAVWFEVLFGQSVVGNTFVPKGLIAEDVAILQRIAHQTVSGGAKPALSEPAATVPAAPVEAGR